MRTNLLSGSIDVLDCTLRDGSYVIDYRFTLEDALLVAVGLQQAGIHWIEIGHGLGVGAHAKDRSKHLTSDEIYLKILRPVIRKSKLGVFCIPGIATLKDLKSIVRQGADFVRVGTDIDRVEKAEAFIKEAKSLGLFAASNFMKSYAYDADFFATQCRRVQGWGADCAYLVDSAGGMLPEEVKAYLGKARAACDIPLGFHGHNNLNLGVANCLAALEGGATLLDATLQGMGRSAGNVQLESLVAVLQKKNKLGHLDLFKLLDLGQNVVRPFMKHKSGVTKIGTVLGTSRFHSSFLPLVKRELERARRTQILPRVLMNIGAANVTKVEPSHVRRALRQLGAVEGAASFGVEDLRLLAGPLSENWRKSRLAGWRAAQPALSRMASLKHKTGKRLVLAASGSFSNHSKKTRFPFIRESSSCVIGVVEIGSKKDADRIFRAVDGRIDFLAVDGDHTTSQKWGLIKAARRLAQKTPVLTYRDLEAWSAGVAQYVKGLERHRIGLLGDEDLISALKKHFSAWKLDVFRAGASDEISSEDILVLCRREPTDIFPAFKAKAMILDATALSLTARQTRIFSKRLEVRRFDGRAGLAAEIESVLAARDFRARGAGRIKFGNFRIVCGGILGRPGDAVVDSFGPSSHLLGIADGKGGLLDTRAARPYRRRLGEVLRFLITRRLNAEGTWEE